MDDTPLHLVWSGDYILSYYWCNGNGKNLTTDNVHIRMETITCNVHHVWNGA
jgi:hypothetical protein